MNDLIEEGDVVKITSGEIKMTVGFVDQGEYAECYYEKDGIIRCQKFPCCILTVVENK